MAELHTLGTPEARSRFNQIHKLYRPTMLNAALGVLKDHHLAEDAVQEAFLRIAKNLHKIDDVDCPPTCAYVVTITRNVSLSMAARLKRQVPIAWLELEEIPDDGMEDVLFHRMDYQLVLSIIQTLPRIYKETLLLYYVEELNTIEIAQRISVGPEAVKKRLQRLAGGDRRHGFCGRHDLLRREGDTVGRRSHAK